MIGNIEKILIGITVPEAEHARLAGRAEKSRAHRAVAQTRDHLTRALVGGKGLGQLENSWYKFFEIFLMKLKL